MSGRRGDSGQSTVEWLGLLAVAALVLSALAWLAGLQLPGRFLADTIARKLVCAVRLSEDCGLDRPLEAAHGGELAALLQAHAPALLYEEGMAALPVDFRHCRQDRCAEGASEGVVSRGNGGPVVAFTHAIDCRPSAMRATVRSGADCSGERAGNLYLQYWFYYPGSATAEGSTPLKAPIRSVSSALGRPSFHPDDWEAYQVRIGPAGRFARASSHKGYSYRLGGRGLIPGHQLLVREGKIELRRRPEVVNGWGPELGTLYVSGGSHAGNAGEDLTAPRSTKDHRLRLIPLREIALRTRHRFAVTPPWEKRVYRDPEYEGTD